jgi:hypothetical protein
MPAINVSHYGGATVRRRIERAGREPLLAGDTLTQEELRAMPTNNLRALIDNRTIEPWPSLSTAPATLHIVSAGKGQFDVIAGEKLTSEPVSKAEAEAIVAKRTN